MPASPPFVDIGVLIRAGAVDQAWALFAQAGLTASEDPAALILKGRLLKERARAARGDARRDLFGQAAGAYREAAARGEGAYALINAASLSLLAGDEEGGRRHALAALAAPGDDTPFYEAATRAEALLLLRRMDEAKAALQQAVARGPRAWEDHAVTLRQFRLILSSLGQPDDWLSILAPPRALHFTGQMTLSADEDALLDVIAGFLERERVAFGYGALAAGADLLVAEALVAAGAELHVILPLDQKAFRARSVSPWGGAWEARYDRLLATAQSVCVTGPGLDQVSSGALALGDETAMGMAVLRAAGLAGDAIQLAVSTRDAADAFATARWRDTDRCQCMLRPTAPVGAAPTGPMPPSRLTSAAALGCVLDLTPDGESEAALAALARLIAAEPEPLSAPSWSGHNLLLTYATPLAAEAVAIRLRDAFGARLRMAAAYGPVETVANPFGAGRLAIGSTPETVADLLRVTPPGGFYLEPCFAATLALDVSNDKARRITNLTGDTVGPYALAPGA
ncbi:hypothetical protein B7G68_16880 [Caulobacter segnis]|uniref:DUF4071 domain-containing protein n=2 Tax=Caulobacter segnis TaxID=88688 RepID=D5VML0_CAUST|nr:tetratricopeptide repeat-containing protein [Caulobacter segnis]ADG11733.1 hypothetical protein Cseg_3297 [Caulobacter segnis ATCC 21756]AVQ03373.1 hypothetical protein B7G68_16880 [Caulobacter segnis]